MSILDFSLRDIGIDLGTANTLVYVKGKGIVLNEPSVVVLNKDTREVLAVGAEAKNMIGRTPDHILAIRPLSDGVIADFEVTQVMLKYFIKQVHPKRTIIQPRVVICVPSGVTEVEKRVLESATIQAGARKVFLIEEPMAAAIGAGLPLEQARGNMIVDIGGGTTEVAIISLGSIVVSRSVRIGGDEIDASIVDYIKKEHNTTVGEKTAEQIKIQIGSADGNAKEKTMNIIGRNLITGLPKNVEINSKEIYEALKYPVSKIIEAITNTLEKIPPELASDIMESGIVIAGGGALLSGIDKKINSETGMPVHIAENPLDCVAIGTGMVLDDIETLKRINNDARRKN